MTTRNLLAVDGNSYTKKMLAHLAIHDDLFTQANHYAVLTVQPPLRARAAMGKEIVDQYYVDETGKILAPVSKFLLRHGIKAERSWKVGAVGQTIAKFADSGKSDLLIMGSHGHGVLANLVLGSVATQVLANCRVPVLLVR